MPLKIYCVSCSFPTEYTLEKPSFCSSCGAKFGGFISSIADRKSTKKLVAIEPEDDDIDDIDGELETEQPKRHKLYGQTSRNNKKIKRVSREIDDNDDNIDIDDLNINALQLDIPISTKKDKGVTLGQVIKEQKTGIERPKPKKVNKKKELETFRIEAGMGGRKDISIEAPEDRE